MISLMDYLKRKILTKIRTRDDGEELEVVVVVVVEEEEVFLLQPSSLPMLLRRM